MCENPPGWQIIRGLLARLRTHCAQVPRGQRYCSLTTMPLRSGEGNLFPPSRFGKGARGLGQENSSLSGVVNSYVVVGATGNLLVLWGHIRI